MACSIVNFCIFLIFFNIFYFTNSQKTVIELDEDNWNEILNGEWLVEFYAPWCPACKALEQKWREFAQLGPGLGIKIGAIDVTTSPGLSGRFMVTALPTIFHVINGQFRQYKGSRDINAFTSFIEDKKWEVVEPVSSWKSPNSIQMGIVSSFFKLSQLLRQIHNKLTEEYGLPSVGSYLIFAIATIILGALLGLILVCAIDLIFPPKHTTTPTKWNKKDDKDSDNELNDEDIKDDLVDDASQSGDGDAQNSGTDSENQISAEKNSTKPKKRRNRKDM
ncbi:thioredoxin-related transmembrane protein 1-like [Diorhabda sublineata]|uniref:thioredoxin-related transmembrane protein 1-like n=1 Tax=Diorhabda sublineata TaxID=1163346 RepID=UPI0024E13D60|nr:thioredoxin-related transmembrane protein 1-like [Diorhabda sublineata]